MIVKNDFLHNLKDFGLNSYESKIWTALLSRGVSTAGELSDIANVPRSRSYDVLESLEKKGFVIMKLGKPIKYIAVPPSEVIERVKKRIQENANEQLKMLNELQSSEILKELNLLHNQGIEMVDPVELSGSFRGRDALYTHLNSMIKKANSEIIVLTSAGGLTRKAKSLSRSLKKAKERGVSIKIAAPVTKENELAAKKLSKIAEVRKTNINSRMVIVDDRDLVFMLLDDNSVHPAYDAGVWVNTPFFTKFMKDTFNYFWTQMEALKK